MGLDMYLKQRVFVGGEYTYRKVTGTVDIKVNEQPLNVPLNKVSEVVLSTAYWRKANQIHNWFIENVQDGEDDCEEYYVSREQLEKLRELSKEVLSTKRVDLLPPLQGFFFGSTEIGEYYYEQLEETVKMLSNLDDEGDYYYQASW